MTNNGQWHQSINDKSFLLHRDFSTDKRFLELTFIEFLAMFGDTNFDNTVMYWENVETTGICLSFHTLAFRIVKSLFSTTQLYDKRT